MTDLEDLMRAHLDAALGDTGSNLPPGAAPVLLKTARRRTRNTRIAVGAGGVAVVAIAAVFIGGSLTSSAGKKANIQPVAPLPGASVAAPTTAPTTPTAATPAVTGTGLVAYPPVTLNSQQLEDQARVHTDTTHLYFDGGQGAGDRTKGFADVTSIDLRTGAQVTLVNALPEPLGGIDVANGNLYIVDAVGKKAVVQTYDASTGAMIRQFPLPPGASDDCPPQGCLEDEVNESGLIASGANLIVTLRARNDTSWTIETVDAATGALVRSTTIPNQNVNPYEVVGSTTYLVAEGYLYAMDAAGKITTIHTAASGSIVSDDGIYAITDNQMGGPDPSQPHTITLARINPSTGKTISSRDFTEPPGSKLSPQFGVVDGHLYYTDGSCPAGGTGQLCIAKVDPRTLTPGATALTVAEPAGAFASLADGQLSFSTSTKNSKGDYTTTAEVSLVEPTG